MSKLLQTKTNYSDEWYTPLLLFKQLNDEFNFNLDPSANSTNRLGLENYYTQNEDGLKQSWNGNVFCNPPYSNIKNWIIKSKEEWLKDKSRKIVMLIPSRTDTKYFHEHIAPFAEVRFIKGRIKFEDINGNDSKTGQFPSMLVIYGNTPNIMQFIKKGESNERN